MNGEYLENDKGTNDSENKIQNERKTSDEKINDDILRSIQNTENDEKIWTMFKLD